MPLTDYENTIYETQEEYHICERDFCYHKYDEKNLKYTKKLEIIVIIQENLEEQLIAFAI